MSNSLFTEVSVAQQETIAGGTLKGIPTGNKFNINVNVNVNPRINTSFNTNIGVGIVIGKNNIINIGQYIQSYP